MSQTAAAAAVSLTLQQVQRYERGSTRTGAGRLYKFARTLDVPIAYSFESHGGKRHRGVGTRNNDALSFRRKTLETATRQLLLDLMRSLSGGN